MRTKYRPIHLAGDSHIKGEDTLDDVIESAGGAFSQSDKPLSIDRRCLDCRDTLLKLAVKYSYRRHMGETFGNLAVKVNALRHHPDKLLAHLKVKRGHAEAFIKTARGNDKQIAKHYVKTVSYHIRMLEQ